MRLANGGRGNDGTGSAKGVGEVGGCEIRIDEGGKSRLSAAMLQSGAMDGRVDDRGEFGPVGGG